MVFDVRDSARSLVRARWFAIGGGLFAMAYGAAGFVDSFGMKGHQCTGYCYNEKAIGWLGGAANNNEDCYLAAKLMRALGAVYVEHQARV